MTETIFCRLTTGVWMSRSSVVYGPFSLVWGFGAVLLTAILYQYRSRSDGFIFLFGTVLGGAYEYVCSVFTELVFGTVFWDYSHLPFNLGRTHQPVILFFSGASPLSCGSSPSTPGLSQWIERLPLRIGRVLSWVLILFMWSTSPCPVWPWDGTPSVRLWTLRPTPRWDSFWTAVSQTAAWSASIPMLFWWTEVL